MLSLAKMKMRDTIIGFVVLVILISTAILVQKSNVEKNLIENIKAPSVESKIKDTFTGLTIPSDTYKTDLTDVSGGDSFGIVTSTEILANLPELVPGESYRASLLKDEKLIQIGTLKNEKGGWILQYDFSKFTGYKVVVSKGVKHILEGSL